MLVGMGLWVRMWGLGVDMRFCWEMGVGEGPRYLRRAKANSRDGGLGLLRSWTVGFLHTHVSEARHGALGDKIH